MSTVNIDVAKETSVQAVNTTVGAVNTGVQAVNTTVGTVNTSVQAVNTTVGAVNTSVQAVNTKVGTSGDTASNTPTTVFAGIKGLIAWFTGTWTAARAAKIDNIEAVWSSLRASYIDTIYAYVTGALYTNSARGAVKGVQRGAIAAGIQSSSYDNIAANHYFYIDIAISPITLIKSTATSKVTQVSVGNYGVEIPSLLISSNALRVWIGNSTSSTFTTTFPYVWEVVEFY